MDIIGLRNHWIKKLRIPSFIGDWLFWLAFTILLVTQFSMGTMFAVYYPSSFPYYLYMVAGMIALIKILLFNDFKDRRDWLLYTVIGLLIWVSCQLANDWNLIYYYLVLLAAQNIKLEKIIKFFLIIIFAGVVITIVSSKLGLIIGLTNNRTNSVGIRYALGMVYPTDLAARAFYLQLFYIVYKRFDLNLPEIISCIAFTFIVYLYTDTRLDLILMVLTIISAIFYKKIVSVIKSVGNKKLSIINLILILGVICLTYLYKPTNLFFKIANKVLSGRLEYGRKAFTRYNVTTFGQYIQQNGNGGIHHGWFDYFFIDCSFLRILMMNGLILFIFVLYALYYLSKRFMQGRYYSLEIALLIVIISSLIDQHLVEISFNVLFMGMFTELSYFKRKEFI